MRSKRRFSELASKPKKDTHIYIHRKRKESDGMRKRWRKRPAHLEDLCRHDPPIRGGGKERE